MPKVAPIPEAAGGSRARDRRVSTSLAEINVVPLVDVMLVLLIIFMVTAPMIQRGIDVKLPVATQSNPIVSERVFVTVPSGYRQNQIVELNGELIHMPALQERIRQLMQNRSEKNVYLRADGRLTVQDMIEVMDKLKAAGVTNVGIVERLPGER